MSSARDKLDRGLSSIHSNFLEVRERGTAGAGRVHKIVAAGMPLHVRVQFRGSLSAAEAAGFKTVWSDGQGSATGTLRLEDVERIATCPEIVSIRFGEEDLPALDVSVPDIHANLVWTLTGGAFSPGNGGTGKGALVGIIDTGIDFRHPFFMADGTNKKTRILRIWDVGLKPVAGEKSPDKALLDPGTPGTYGVEYEDKDINDVLKGVAGKRVRHRDCSTHGTHVASTAAGDGRPGFRYVGVAPQAGIVVVKLLHIEEHPFVNGAFLSFEQIFRDAVTYLRKIADKLGKPIAINFSAGSMLGPHDGFGDREHYLDTEFDDANSAGKVFIAAAGNSADARVHARIEFPASGASVEIPLELFDKRLTRVEHDSCREEPNVKDADVQCYYPFGGAALTAEFKPLGETTFTSPPLGLGGGDVTGTFSQRNYTLSHKTDAFTPPGSPPGGTVRRNVVTLEIKPHPDRDHLLGKYSLRLTATGQLTVHVWTFQYRGPNKGHGFKIGSPVPSEVLVEDLFLVSTPACAKGAIAVAAFDAEAAGLPIANFSSPGPLVRYDATLGAPPPKPDLAAPGVSIDAAKSQHIMPPHFGDTITLKGTSMAAPHVTGAAALILEKSPTLTPSQVLAALRLGIRPVPLADEDTFGAGRLDANGAIIVI